MSLVPPLEAVRLAHDIAFAVFRVAALVRHKILRIEIETAAIYLLKDLEFADIERLERLVRLAEDVGEMAEINAIVLSRELDNLREVKLSYSAIAESIAGLESQIDLEEIFDKTEKSRRNKEKQLLVRVKERHSAILESIRQLPDGCRMKDLVSQFPRVSERTLRSDIQRLIDQGLLERSGGKSGPFSYFRVVEGSAFAKASADAVGCSNGE